MIKLLITDNIYKNLLAKIPLTSYCNKSNMLPDFMITI